jgi:hypothetical protein
MRLKQIGILLLAVAALACGSCATTDGAAPAGGHRRASIASANQWRGPLNAVTGNNATIIVWDGTGMVASQPIERVMVSCYFDQAVTILFQVRHIGSATWRTINGSGSGDAVSASTPTVIDYLLLGSDNRIEVVTGGTGPTVSEVDVGLVFERPVAM